MFQFKEDESHGLRDLLPKQEKGIRGQRWWEMRGNLVWGKLGKAI